MARKAKYIDATPEMILRRIPAWQVVVLLRDFKAGRSGIVSSASGGSGGDAEGGWYFTDAKGLGWSRHEMRPKPEDASLVLVTWPQIRAWVNSIPAEKAADLIEAVRIQSKVRRTFVPFRASKEATGCGPFHGKPESEWTPAQKLYHSEAEKHREEVLDPYYARCKAVDEIVRERHEALFRAEVVTYVPEVAESA